MKPRAAILAFMMTFSLVTGCSGSSPKVVDQLLNRRVASTRTQPYDSFSDLLPNHTYRMGEGPEFRMSDVVVLGSLGAVAAGKAYSAEESPRGVEIDFYSSEAAWRTYHVQIKVDKVLAGSLRGDAPTMGLALGGDADIDGVTKDLRDLGKVVVLLRPSPVFDYATGLLGSTEDGAFIGQVDASGRVTFPVLSKDEARSLAPDLTVDDITAAAAEPDVSVLLDASGSSVISERPAAG